MADEQKGTSVPQTGDDGDGTSKTKDQGQQLSDPSEGKTIPKSRFDEVIIQKRDAEERANLWKSRAEDAGKVNDEQQGKNESLEAELKDKDRAIWKSNALHSINSQVAKVAESMGANFTGESQEEYDAWAKNLESTTSDYLKEDKGDVDGNRGGATPREMTDEEMMKMTPEQRIEYRKKTLPRVNEG